jgi:hypothetical protein
LAKANFSLNFFGEIKRRIFCQTPFASNFSLSKKFDEIDPWSIALGGVCQTIFGAETVLMGFLSL